MEGEKVPTSSVPQTPHMRPTYCMKWVVIVACSNGCYKIPHLFDYTRANRHISIVFHDRNCVLVKSR